jgi:hypothetical protein
MANTYNDLLTKMDNLTDENQKTKDEIVTLLSNTIHGFLTSNEYFFELNEGIFYTQTNNKKIKIEIFFDKVFFTSCMRVPQKLRTTDSSQISFTFNPLLTTQMVWHPKQKDFESFYSEKLTKLLPKKSL